MYKADMKLPEVKYLMELDNDLSNIIHFLEEGNYSGDHYGTIVYSESIIKKYGGSNVFASSNVLNNIDNFMKNLSVFAIDGYIKLSEEKNSDFQKLAKDIICEYSGIMGKYSRVEK